MQYKSLLIDIGGMDACCTDHALESLAKAISGEGGDSPDIWAKHESPFVQSIIELFTQRGLLRIQKVQEGLHLWIDGKMHNPQAHAPKFAPVGFMQTWTDAESDLVHLYLTSLAPEAFTFDDWGLVVDYLMHTYMPADVMKTEAEWLSTRSGIMGRIQANLDAKAVVSVAAADALVGALPLTVQAAISAPEFSFADAMKGILEYGRVHCMEQVVYMSETLRHKIKKTIIDHQAAVFVGDPIASKEVLQTKLFDDFSTANRDWRRIAVTEAGEMCNQGVIASLAPGSRVRRVEMYKGACPFCRKIDGRVMNVVPANAPNKDGEQDVWIGKTNVGRSAAPRKRIGNELVERLDTERWWIPAGTVHPHCRGTWHVMPEAKPHDDPAFAAWLNQHFHKIKTA